MDKKTYIKVKLLSPNSIKLLKILITRNACRKDLLISSNIPSASVSNYLNIFKSAKMIDINKLVYNRLYSLNEKGYRIAKICIEIDELVDNDT